MKILFSVVLPLLIAAALFIVVLGEDDAAPPTTTETTVPESTTSSEVTTSLTSTEPSTTSTTPSTTDGPTSSTTDGPTSSTTDGPTSSTTDGPTSSTTDGPTSSTTDGPTSSTTEGPTSSTTAVPVTTKAPEPPATVPAGSWNVTQDNETICIRLEMKAFFEITLETSTEYIVVYPNASSKNSNCKISNSSQILFLSDLNSYNFSMIFEKDGGRTFVNDTFLEYTLPEGRGSVSTNAKLFNVKSGKSYKCNSKTSVKLGNVTLVLEDVHVEAFGAHGNTDFSDAEECESDDKVNDAIPIAVGCALAALIIIVLIAYLVGRRQSRQRGYQSV